MTTPCKDCTKREFKCHGRCPEYQAFRAEKDKQNAQHINDIQLRETLIQGSTRRGITPRRRGE